MVQTVLSRNTLTTNFNLESRSPPKKLMFCALVTTFKQLGNFLSHVIYI